MSSLLVFLAPLALAAAAPQPEPTAAAPPLWTEIFEAFVSPAAHQVRIEQRVVVRVAPRVPAREMLAALPPAPLASRFKERKVGKCLALGGIAGVQIDRADDRLLLFMRDQRLIAASLEKACAARDFYSGFYVERSGDGQLCIDRDTLHARTGTTCSVSKLRQLVATDDD
ncbi:MAG TPA: hypothetical protein VM055_07865 [Novosphingobium sp.]|nr:hypothetical protein [Novosphingobium sp.]